MAHTIDIPHKASLPPGQRANRCRADELNEAYKLHHQIQARFDAVRKAAEPKIQPGQRQLFDPIELETKKEWLSELTGDNQKGMFKILDKLSATGPFRNVARAPDPAVLDALLNDFPNFASATKAIQKHLLLCRLGPEKLLKIPAILLDGPPGIGKTAYCGRLAKLLGIRFEQIDLSSGGANFTMTGLDSGYGSGHPGRIWESLQHDSLSVLWQLDEVEKSAKDGKYGGNQYLLSLLEPESSKRFIDNATLLPLNGSWLIYIATSNDKTAIDAPLRSRFEIFDIQKPDRNQLLAVVRSIHRGIQESEAWAQSFTPELSGSVVEALSEHTPREIRRALIDAFANAASEGRDHLVLSDVGIRVEAPDETGRRIGFI